MRTFSIIGKLLIGGLLLFAVGCENIEEVARDVDPLMVLDDESVFVMELDYTDFELLGDLEKLLSGFQELEIWGMFGVDFYYASFLDEVDKEFGEKGFEEMVKPIFDGGWKFVLGVDEDAFADFMNGEEESVGEYYVALEVLEAEKFESLISQYMGRMFGARMKVTEKGAYKFWIINDEIDSLYVTRYGDLFIITNSQENVDRAMKRISKGNGFVDDLNFVDKGVRGRELAFVYFDSAVAYAGGNDKQWFSEDMEDYLKNSGRVFLNASVEEDGFRFMSFSEYYENMLGEILDDEAVVPGDGVFMYFEVPSLNTVLNPLAMIVSQVLGVVPDTAGMLAATVGVERDAVFTLFDDPFSFVLTDVGASMPSVSFYFNAETKNFEVFEAVHEYLNRLARDVILQFDLQMRSAEDPSEGLFVFEKMEEKMSRVHVDTKKIPKEVLAEYSEILDKAEAFELYYGFVGEKYVISFFPRFIDFLKGQKLEDSEFFEYASSKLKMGSDGRLIYVNFLPILDLMDKYVELADLLGDVSEAEVDDYLMVRDFLDQFQYLIGESHFENNVSKSELFLGVDVE